MYAKRPNSCDKVRLSVSIDSEVFKTLDSFCKKHGLYRSSAVSVLLSLALNAFPKNQTATNTTE